MNSPLVEVHKTYLKIYFITTTGIQVPGKYDGNMIVDLLEQRDK